MRSLLRAGVFAGAVTAAWGFTACGFHVNGATTDGGGGGGGGSDGGIDSGSSGIDAGSDGGVTALCTMGTQYCSGSDAVTCDPDTGSSTTTTCSAWGCVSNGGAHCGSIAPSGGFATAADTVDGSNALGSANLPDGVFINQVTGQILNKNGSTFRGSGTGIDPTTGIDFEIRTIGTAQAGVFRFTDLTITGSAYFVSSGPSVVLIATDTYGIDLKPGAKINVQGDCADNDAGPGGFAGGAVASNASGSGGGGGSTHGDSGGVGAGGGGYGASGGSGGNGGANATPAGGTAFGIDAIALLIGGGGGGGGSGSAADAVYGGGGGGGLQLVANNMIVIEGGAAINAGGCGGTSGVKPSDSGAGGGAGGTILMEGYTISFGGNGQLAVNGGGGGANYGDGTATTQKQGADGGLGSAVAMGAKGFAANGGSGGAGTTAAQPGYADTYPPSGSTTGYASGGGGAVGRIRLNTFSGSASLGTAVLSPPLSTAGTPTTCTEGTATVQ